MPYAAITSRRIPFDIDGTIIGTHLNSTNYDNGITSYLNATEISNINNESLSDGLANTFNRLLWFFFPEKVEIEHMYVAVVPYSGLGANINIFAIQGSNDTTNGVDGTWETATAPNGSPFSNNPTTFSWRNGLVPISFSSPMKVIRIGCGAPSGVFIKYVHIYGRKASGETPDDILFCNASTGNELTALKDWGDRPEGTTVVDSFKLKNASTTKIANNVNLQLNHADFGMSFSENGPWTATLDITSIAANSLSATVYVRNLLGPPLLALGPKAARVIATVGSFT